MGNEKDRSLITQGAEFRGLAWVYQDKMRLSLLLVLIPDVQHMHECDNIQSEAAHARTGETIKSHLR